MPGDRRQTDDRGVGARAERVYEKLSWIPNSTLSVEDGCVRDVNSRFSVKVRFRALQPP
jgi:hypothetical protein